MAVNIGIDFLCLVFLWEIKLNNLSYPKLSKNVPFSMPHAKMRQKILKNTKTTL